MFVDNALVAVKAGDGGGGIVSFRHEKYVDKGGPDGGDGGKGGDVIFRGRENQHTLARFRHQKELRAKSGATGGKRKRRGKSAENLIVDVPVGTTITDATTGNLIVDITEEYQESIVAMGGSGGFGNAHFTSSTRQAPRIAEKGEPGEDRQLQLELKMIADVGLVGLPNAGKSTLLSVVSNARPEIADYPFTTIQPNLGVVDVDERTSLLMADIPGLIEGASAGKGLGDEFLRHVERTAVLLHVIDVYQEDIASAYKTIQGELASYKVDLSQKPQIIALSKIEALDEDIVQDRIKELTQIIPKYSEVYPISAQAHKGIDKLLYRLTEIVETERAHQQAIIEEQEETVPVIRLPEEDSRWLVEKTDKGFLVTGRKIEKFAHKTDFQSDPAVGRLRDIMQKMGIMHELERRGVEPDDRIYIRDIGQIRF